MTSVAFSMTLPLPTTSRAPSNAVTSASAGPAKAASAAITATATAFNRHIGASIAGNLQLIFHTPFDVGRPLEQRHLLSSGVGAAFGPLRPQRSLLRLHFLAQPSGGGGAVGLHPGHRCRRAVAGGGLSQAGRRNGQRNGKTGGHE